MADPIIKTRQCRDCGVAFELPPSRGGRRVLCRACRLASDKRSCRKYYDRTAEIDPTPATFTCRDCGVTESRKSTKGRAAFRCRACKRLYENGVAVLKHATNDARRLKISIAGRAKREAANAVKPAFSCCRVCDVRLPRLGKKTRKICVPCGRNERRLANGTVRPATCKDCQQPLDVILKGKVRTRCDDCSRRHSRALRRLRKATMEFETFPELEIFERDKWRCGICSKRINRKLRYPHPLSVSLDHIIPISEGGGHLRTNVRASHLVCNTARGNRGGNEQLMLVG